MSVDRAHSATFQSKGTESGPLAHLRKPNASSRGSTLQCPNPVGVDSCTSKDNLRQHVVRAMAAMVCAELEQFLCAMFHQDHLLSAYFRPTKLAARGSDMDHPRTVLPLDMALAAARRASAMPVLLRHERGLASVAALAYPCAIFHAADPSLRSFARCGGNAPSEELLLLRQILLEDPLRALRARDPQLGAALGAALGFAHSDCEGDQSARLVSSVRLATIDIDHLWAQVNQ